jgi:hypothetical protein
VITEDLLTFEDMTLEFFEHEYTQKDVTDHLKDSFYFCQQNFEGKRRNAKKMDLTPIGPVVSRVRQG